MYAVMAVTGMLVAGHHLCRSAKRRDMDVNEVIVLSLVICVGILVGSHILFALVNYATLPALFHQTNWKDAFQALRLAFGGSVFYGGLIGGLLTALLYLRHRQLDLADHADLLAPAAPLFHGFARIGCFLGGCCYGVASPFGFVYSHSLVPEADGVRRFPVQLLEAAFDFCLFLFLSRLERKGRGKGLLFPIYLICYTAFRFGDEFLRGDAARGIWGAFSTSQWISLVLFAASLLFLLFRRKNNRSTEKGAAAPQ